jgi:hypothetical protein
VATRTRAMALAAALLALVGTAAHAQKEVRDKPFIEEEKRAELDRTISYAQDALFDWGGWINVSYIGLDDPPANEHRELEFYDLRLWGKLQLGELHRFYARTYTQFVDFNDGDAFWGADNDVRGMNLDQGFYTLDLGQAFKARPRWKSYLTLGRQYAFLGRGILFNKVAEGIQWKSELGLFDWKAQLLKTVESQADFDGSRPGSGSSRRYFLGTELRYLGLGKHQIYAMNLLQRDHNGEEPEDPAQDFDYDSQHYGLGVRGQFWPTVRYWGEGLYETGRSYASGATGDREDIRAWGSDVGIEWLPVVWSRPRFSLEYMFGSGDEDRGSVTNTVGGNQAGTDDNALVTFGYLQTGYALFPRLSNIHIWRLGASFKPLQAYALLEEFELGTNFYLYRKDEADGAISDARANVADKDIGNEWDLFMRWRILSDLNAAANWGLFDPGDAYADPNDRSFFSFSLTYSF